MVRSTAREIKAQTAIMKYMAEEGYGTFAKLFSLYTFILTKDPNCIGYTTPDGVICLNEDLSMDGFSFVCRHEILHQWLNHHENFIKHVGKKLGLDPENMSLDEINQAAQIIYGDPNRADNIAKDWDLSRYYTDEDKRLAKHLECCGKVCEGLVLELDKPEWLNLSAEEMYDKMVDNPEENPNNRPPSDEQQGDGDEGNGQGGQSGGGGQSGDDSDSNDQGSGEGDDGSQSGEGGESDPRNPGNQSGGRNNKGKQQKGGSNSDSQNTNGQSGEPSGQQNQGGEKGNGGNVNLDDVLKTLKDAIDSGALENAIKDIVDSIQSGKFDLDDVISKLSGIASLAGVDIDDIIKKLKDKSKGRKRQKR